MFSTPSNKLVIGFLWGVLVAPPALAQHSAQPFDSLFEDAAMRVDYHHYGDAATENISVDAVIREEPWPGPAKNLTAAPDYGKYRFRVVDLASGQSIFEQGYSTLFGEWQTTGEAKKVEKVFHETVRFPYPRRPVRLEVFTHDAKGELVEIFREVLDPASHLVRRPEERKDAEVLLLADGGEPRTSLDVVIIADGYTPDQADKARKDLQRYSEVLLTSPPFDKHRKRISVRGVVSHAEYSGPEEPRKAIFNTSRVGCTFNTFDSARYLTTLRNREMRDLAALVPYDAIFIMVNSSRYGGAGIYNFFSIFVSDNEYDEYVFIHEFGHGFAGLADEYYSSSVAYSDFYPRGVEPREPNITALLETPDKLKWKGLVKPGTPIPTPPENDAGRVGAFEGAGYSAKGLYRPAVDCKMKSKRAIDFCPVCMRAVEDAIRYYTE